MTDRLSNATVRPSVRRSVVASLYDHRLNVAAEAGHCMVGSYPAGGWRGSGVKRANRHRTESCKLGWFGWLQSFAYVTTSRADISATNGMTGSGRDGRKVAAAAAEGSLNTEDDEHVQSIYQAVCESSLVRDCRVD